MKQFIFKNSIRSAKWTVLLLLLISSQTFAQDTLIYKNGTKKTGKILEFDNRGLIICVVEGDTLYISQSALSSYILHSEISEPSLPAVQVITEQPADVDVYWGKRTRTRIGKLFNDPARYNYGRLSISTNLTGYIPGISNAPPHPDNNIYFCENPSIGFAVDYRLHDKLALSIPVLIGFKTNIQSHTGGFYYDWQFGYNADHVFGLQTYNSSYRNGHPRNMLYQVGLCPKFYPAGERKNSFYISQGLHFGRADFHAANYYYTMESQPYPTTWTITQKTIETRSNEFFYFRYEALLGLQFNLSKTVCWSMESGYSTAMQNNGTEEDHLYQQVDGSDFALIHSEIYSGPKLGGHFIYRVHLVFRFGGEKINERIEE